MVVVRPVIGNRRSVDHRGTIVSRRRIVSRCAVIRRRGIQDRWRNVGKSIAVIGIPETEARGTDRYGKVIPRRCGRGHRGAADEQYGCGKSDYAMLHLYLLLQESRDATRH